jgi:hypothetical protein
MAPGAIAYGFQVAINTRHFSINSRHPISGRDPSPSRAPSNRQPANEALDLIHGRQTSLSLFAPGPWLGWQVRDATWRGLREQTNFGYPKELSPIHASDGFVLSFEAEPTRVLETLEKEVLTEMPNKDALAENEP